MRKRFLSKKRMRWLKKQKIEQWIPRPTDLDREFGIQIRFEYALQEKTGEFLLANEFFYKQYVHELMKRINMK